jgi:glycosyltransferase involved in cell wall biosynthesis
VKDYLSYRDEEIAAGIADGSLQVLRPDAPKEKISILLPTRGRPENIRRLLQSLVDTSNELPEVVMYVDLDDATMQFGSYNPDIYPADKLILVPGPRIVLSQCWNKCLEHASGDILMHGGDDIVFKTKGWDDMVRRGFGAHADRIVFIHGDDGYWGNRFGTHGFIHRKWVEAVGYFVPPYFSSDYNDTWLNDVANAIQRRMYLPFVTEHMHFLFGKGEKDQTHIERLERHKKDEVDKLYKDLSPKRIEDAEKLLAAIAQTKQ